MKILIITHGFPPAAEGGTEIYAQAHARALRALGDEVLVLTREHDEGRSEYAIRRDLRDGLHIVAVNNTFRRTRTFEETYCNEAIGAVVDQLIDQFRPDLAHIHHLTCLSTTIVQSLAARSIPSFFTLHDYWLICHRGQLLDLDYQVCDGPEPDGCGNCLGPAGSVGRVGFLGAATLRAVERRLPIAGAGYLRRSAERLAAASFPADTTAECARRRVEHMRAVCDKVTHFIAPSQHMRDRFERFGVPHQRISVGAYGFDHSLFRGLERTASDRLRLGFLGTLMVSKAPHVLLEAVNRLPRGRVSVDLFGGHGTYHGDDSYRRQLDPLLAGACVRAHGRIGHDQVAQALSSIDLLVVPSIWPENSPLVIQEAFLAGAPVVASHIGGIPEAVEDGRSGILFRAGDVDDLARILHRMIREPEVLQKLRRAIPSVRTIEDDVRATRALYQTELRSRGPTRVIRTHIAAVVLNHRTPDDTLLTVKSLLALRSQLDDIIVVNNDSDDELRRTLATILPRVAYIHTGRNLGFSGGMNAGIRQALARDATHVLLVNSDVIVPPNCLEQLTRDLSRDPRIGIVGPRVLARSEPDRVSTLELSYRPLIGRMKVCGAGSLAQIADPRARIVDGVSGCLMLIKREVFDAIGLLDEDYFFGFEDLDFCLRARRAGLLTALVESAVAFHEGSRSIGSNDPRRLYFAVRNHLLMAKRAGPSTNRAVVLGRACSIVVLNLAHALRSSRSLPARVSAVLCGTRDYLCDRFGEGSDRAD